MYIVHTISCTGHTIEHNVHTVVYTVHTSPYIVNCWLHCKHCKPAAVFFLQEYFNMHKDREVELLHSFILMWDNVFPLYQGCHIVANPTFWLKEMTILIVCCIRRVYVHWYQVLQTRKLLWSYKLREDICDLVCRSAVS